MISVLWTLLAAISGHEWGMQARNQGGAWRQRPLRNIFAPLGKMYWTSFKIIGHISKNLAPLRKLFAPPGVPSWLRIWRDLSQVLLSFLGILSNPRVLASFSHMFFIFVGAWMIEPQSWDSCGSFSNILLFVKMLGIFPFLKSAESVELISHLFPDDVRRNVQVYVTSIFLHHYSLLRCMAVVNFSRHWRFLHCPLHRHKFNMYYSTV